MRMTDNMIDQLEERLLRPLPADVHHEVIALARHAELEVRGPRRLPSRRGLVALVIAGVVSVSGGAVAYAAPQTWAWLFPAPVSKSFTFPSGLVCSVDITVSADYSGGKNPTRGEFDTVERAAAAVDVSRLDIDSYLARAQVTQGSLEAVSPYVVEREAIQLAVHDDMMSRTGGPSGATWSTSTTCA
jgi:hypothetical protein